MNERIKELAEQAGIVKPEIFRQHIDALQLEKFAELIIRECIDIPLNKTTLETNEDYREGFHRARQFIYQDIKQHFGVE